MHGRVENPHEGSISPTPTTTLDVWIRRIWFGKSNSSWELRRWLFGRVVSCSGDVLGALRKRTREC